jgi:DNA-binding IclR family transcriptional regulator
MGVCAVATPVQDAVGAVGALTVEIPAASLQENGREEHIVEALLRHRDRAHRALLGSPRRDPDRRSAAD